MPRSLEITILRSVGQTWWMVCLGYAGTSEVQQWRAERDALRFAQGAEAAAALLGVPTHTKTI